MYILIKIFVWFSVVRVLCECWNVCKYRLCGVSGRADSNMPICYVPGPYQSTQHSSQILVLGHFAEFSQLMLGGIQVLVIMWTFIPPENLLQCNSHIHKQSEIHASRMYTVFMALAEEPSPSVSRRGVAMNIERMDLYWLYCAWFK